MDQIGEDLVAKDKAEWIRTLFLSYRDNPPCREDKKTGIPWPEWRDSILGVKTEETDGFKTGDGVKTAERILKKFSKKGYRRPATKAEIKEIEERDAKRRENK